MPGATVHSASSLARSQYIHSFPCLVFGWDETGSVRACGLPSKFFGLDKESMLGSFILIIFFPLRTLALKAGG
jgi:hypothetical protein